MRRIVVFLLVACVVVIATSSWWSAETAPPMEAPVPTDGSPAAGQVVEAGVARMPDAGLARAAEAQQTRDEVDTGAGSSTDTGYTGRVVASDGTPVAAIEVQLLRVAADAALPFDLDVFAHTPSAPRLVVAMALTDAEGRFELKGIAPRGLCALRLAFADVRAAPPRFRSGRPPLSTSCCAVLSSLLVVAAGLPLGRLVTGGPRLRPGQPPRRGLVMS